MARAKTTNVKIDHITLAPHRHETLNDDLMARIKWFTDILCKAGEGGDDTTFEHYVDGFRRDMHPEREVAIWEHIALVYSAYREQHPDLTTEDKRAALAVLVMASMGQAMPPDWNRLPSDAVGELSALYRQLATPNDVQ